MFSLQSFSLLWSNCPISLEEGKILHHHLMLHSFLYSGGLGNLNQGLCSRIHFPRLWPVGYKYHERRRDFRYINSPTKRPRYWHIFLSLSDNSLSFRLHCPRHSSRWRNWNEHNPNAILRPLYYSSKAKKAGLVTKKKSHHLRILFLD